MDVITISSCAKARKSRPHHDPLPVPARRCGMTLVAPRASALMILATLAVCNSRIFAEDVSPASVVPCELTANRLVLVPVTINGTGPYRFLLDTGGASTIIRGDLARRLGLPRTGDHEIETVGGTRDLPRGTVAELRLGAERFTDVDVLWMDLEGVRRVDARIQGIIGQDLLRTRNFLLDYESRRLVFDSETAVAVSGRSIPVDWEDGRPLIDALFVDDRAHDRNRNGNREPRRYEWRFVLDSAVTDAILFDRASAPLPDSLRRRATTTMMMQSHVSSRPVMTTMVTGLTIAGVAVREMVAAIVPIVADHPRVEHGLLPASVFRAIYFDNRASRIVINPARLSTGSEKACTAPRPARQCTPPAPSTAS
jgi:Aspartyl protease